MALDPREAPAGRVWREGGGRVLLSQRGAAGSLEDVCPAHSYTSQQLARPGMGMIGTQGPAQEKGSVRAKLDHCSPAPRLASPELNGEAENHHHHHPRLGGI